MQRLQARFGRPPGVARGTSYVKRKSDTRTQHIDTPQARRLSHVSCHWWRASTRRYPRQGLLSMDLDWRSENSRVLCRRQRCSVPTRRARRAFPGEPWEHGRLVLAISWGNEGSTLSAEIENLIAFHAGAVHRGRHGGQEEAQTAKTQPTTLIPRWPISRRFAMLSATVSLDTAPTKGFTHTLIPSGNCGSASFRASKKSMPPMQDDGWG